MKVNDTVILMYLRNFAQFYNEELVATKCVNYRYDAYSDEYICTRAIGIFRNSKFTYIIRVAKLLKNGEFGWVTIAEIPFGAIRYIEDYAVKYNDINMLIYYLSDNYYLTSLGKSYIPAAVKLLLELAKASQKGEEV